MSPGKEEARNMAKDRAWAQPLFKQSVNQMEELGIVRRENDGREFAYALAGVADLAAGKLVISAVPTDNAKDETLSADAAIGAMSISMTFGGAVVADYFKDGWIWPNDSTGEGHLYRVAGHPAFASAAITVSLKDPLRVALTAGASVISAVVNRQKGVVLSTFAQTGNICGVPPMAVTAAYYFWNQVKGPAVVWVSGTLVIGDQVGQIAVAGAVTPLGANDVIGSLGTAMKVNTTTHYGLINLAIPGY
jgi:hypothetical protein